MDAVWRARSTRRRCTKKYIFRNLCLQIISFRPCRVVDRVGGCQPCFLVPRLVQPMSQVLVTTECCDLMIPHMSWPTYVTRFLYAPTDGCHIAKQVPMLLRFLIIVCMAHVCAYVGVYKYVCTSDFWGGRSSCVPLVLLRQVCQSCYSCVPLLGWVPFVFELGSGFASLVFQWDSWKIAVSVQQSIL